MLFTLLALMEEWRQCLLGERRETRILLLEAVLEKTALAVAMEEVEDLEARGEGMVVVDVGLWVLRRRLETGGAARGPMVAAAVEVAEVSEVEEVVTRGLACHLRKSYPEHRKETNITLSNVETISRSQSYLF